MGLLLPVWAEKDVGPWQVFGGGGYQINTGANQRNFWQGGVAVNRTMTQPLAARRRTLRTDPQRFGRAGYTAVNVGATVTLVEHWSLLASLGPTWEQRGGSGQVFYLSLKADY